MCLFDMIFGSSIYKPWSEEQTPYLCHCVARRLFFPGGFLQDSTLLGEVMQTLKTSQPSSLIACFSTFSWGTPATVHHRLSSPATCESLNII